MESDIIYNSPNLIIFQHALKRCCDYCHIIAKEYEYDIITDVKSKYGGRITTERLRNCYKCDYYILMLKGFIKSCSV